MTQTAPFYLLYQTGLAPTNGTSVQLLRLLKSIEDAAVHLLWDTGEAGAVSVKQSLVLDDGCTQKPVHWPEAGTPRGVDTNWWNGAKLNKQRLQNALKVFPAQPVRAWVLCGNERDAARASEVLEALDRPPFLLHIMDIFENRILPATMPHFFELVRLANQVVCTSAAAAIEIRKHRSGETHVLPCCSDFTAHDRRPWNRPFRIGLTGALWDKALWNRSPALDLLAEAWPRIKQRIDHIELHYAGSFADHLPSNLTKDVQNHGFLAPPDCEQFLRNCHLAYLPVSLNDRFGPYSVPSRLADYLACGLPTITYTSPSTGIFSFTQAAPPGSCVNVSDICELITAVGAFASDRVRWERAAANAASYAKQALHADHIRSQLLEYLDRCTGAR